MSAHLCKQLYASWRQTRHQPSPPPPASSSSPPASPSPSPSMSPYADGKGSRRGSSSSRRE
ncbi:hypothetical protein TCAP_02143 [Tolypocladium capitatum]|uniref:Uncharacterized protein n=1 Tax=Tolypocladium capitatum TaxID=45235 RepID=A0A2K3QK92_9HYPO|nr:hypothetical protein TCAP_02143 [Tolypocladium capitatum]